MARSPSFMVVSTQHGFKSLKDLIAYAKAQPQGIHLLVGRRRQHRASARRRGGASRRPQGRARRTARHARSRERRDGRARALCFRAGAERDPAREGGQAADPRHHVALRRALHGRRAEPRGGRACRATRATTGSASSRPPARLSRYASAWRRKWRASSPCPRCASASPRSGAEPAVHGPGGIRGLRAHLHRRRAQARRPDRDQAPMSASHRKQARRRWATRCRRPSPSRRTTAPAAPRSATCFCSRDTAWTCPSSPACVRRASSASTSTLDEGYATARAVALTMLATIKAHAGDLDRVKRVLRLFGMVNCTPDFTQPPQVIDGASDLFFELWGPEFGKHARSAVGHVSASARHRGGDQRRVRAARVTTGNNRTPFAASIVALILRVHLNGGRNV